MDAFTVGLNWNLYWFLNFFFLVDLSLLQFSTRLMIKHIGVYHSCGTFLYRERLQQQNADMRKRDKVESTCTWLHLVQGQICSLSPPCPSPPALTPPPPPINVITGSQPALCFRPPPLHPHPPEDYSQILATWAKIEDGLHLGACEYGGWIWTAFVIMYEFSVPW